MAEQRWPEGHRSCVTLTVDVDAESVDLAAVPHSSLYGRYSHGRYATQVGVPRLLSIFDRLELSATFFVPAWDAREHPGLVERMVSEGHELAAHGYMHEDHSRLGHQEQRTIERAHETLTKLVGESPKGWRAPGGLLSPDTLSYLQALSYVYDASFVDSDLPYYHATSLGPLLELPQFPFLNDHPFYSQLRPPEDVTRVWEEEFEAIHEEGLFFSLKIHPRGDYGAARGTRANHLERVLRRLRDRSDVWFATQKEVAAWWQQRSADPMRSVLGDPSDI